MFPEEYRVSKAVVVLMFFLTASIPAWADLTKTTQGGIAYISGYVGQHAIYIRKYKSAGRCFTDGYIDTQRFSMLVYKEAGNLHISGAIPKRVENLLVSFGFSKPYN